MTGATVTSRAVARALEGTGKRLAEPVFERPYAGRGTGLDLADPRLLYLLVALVLTGPVFLFAGRRQRRLWLLVHAAVGGFWLGLQLSTVQVLGWLRLEPDLSLGSWSSLLFLVPVLVLAAGPFYCGYLCPAGAVQELLGLVGRARRLPAEIDRPARFVKYVLLAVLVVGALGFGSEAIEGLDLLREVWAAQRTGAGILLLLLAAGGSLVVVRFGCRYLCPTGAFLNLLGKVAPLKRRLPAKRYPACDLGVRGLPDVDCLQCNRCLVGEQAAAAPAWRVRVFAVALALCLLLLAVAGGDWGPGEAGVPSVEPQIQPVDAALLKMKTEAGSLSDKQAEYWHVVER